MIEISGIEFQNVCARNSSACVDYVIQSKGHIALTILFDGILEPNDLVSTQYCFHGHPLDLSFFKDIDNWYPNYLSIQMFNNLSRLNIDAFDIGFHSVYQSSKSKNIVVIGIMKALGAIKMAQKISSINSLYNRTKKAKAVEKTGNMVVVRVDYHQGFAHTTEITRQNIGAYVAGLKLVGKKEVQYEILSEDFSVNNGHTQFRLTWEVEPIWQRLRWLSGRFIACLLAKTYLKSHGVVQEFHSELVASLHEEIDKKEKASKTNEEYYQAMIVAQQEQTERLEKQVKKKTFALRQALVDKQQLFNDFSHEVRTPLMLAINPIKRAQDLIRDPKCQSLLATAKVNLEDLDIMFRQLYRLEQIKRTESELGNFDLARIASHVIESLQHLAKELGIVIKSEIASSRYIRVQAGTIELILKNLLENALKYCSVGDEVCLSVIKANEKQLCLVVEDTGHGIPEAHREKIFQRFHRVPGVENIRGSGIGLAIVKQWVEENNGQIKCTASKSGGARFEIGLEKSDVEIDKHLPLQEIDLLPFNTFEAASNHTIPKYSLEKKQAKVLLVEDNFQLREYLFNLFNKGFDCLQAEDGEEAWKLVLSHHPDLIVSDVMMPNLNGYDLTKRVKNHIATSHIPVILLTAKGDTDSQLVGLEVQADDYLAKPIDDGVLLQKITNMLNQQQRLTNYIKREIERGSNVDKYLNLTQEKWKMQLDDYLEKHYADEQLTIGNIAKELAMSERKMQMVFKKSIGMTPVQYRKMYRLNKAKAMIKENPQDSLTKTAVDCGFSSLQSFSRAYKEQFGVVPSTSVSN